MNRRKAVKGVLAFGVLGTSVFSLAKWFSLNKPFQISQLIDQKLLIAELAETIIPKTTTPGAKDAKVEDFIINILVYCTDNRNQNKFLSGLNELEERSINLFDKKFENCEMPEKISILKYFEDKSSLENTFLVKVQNRLLGKSFFSKLKELTVKGYFTSMEGATQCLSYDYVPGRYEACISLKPGQKSWATK